MDDSSSSEDEFYDAQETTVSVASQLRLENDTGVGENHELPDVEPLPEGNLTVNMATSIEHLAETTRMSVSDLSTTLTVMSEEQEEATILRNVPAKNLDTNETMPLSVALETLPQGTDPLSIKIAQMRGVTEKEDGDTRSISSKSASDNKPGSVDTKQIKAGVKKLAHALRNSGKKSTASDESDIVGAPGVKIIHKGGEEFSGMRIIQELTAPRTGAVWSMKFSLDGRLLATGGQDKLVRVWCVAGMQPYFQAMKETYVADDKGQRPDGPRDPAAHGTARQTPNAPVTPPPRPPPPTIPFQLNHTKHAIRPVFDSQPFITFTGHEADVLDMTWSKNHFLLTSSMDKTVRLWHITQAQCLCVFQHPDFVTAIAFHPKDDRYFISGSLDCRVRLWSIPQKSVTMWNEVDNGSIITAASFCSNGRMVVIGTYDGRCLFYDSERLKYHTQIMVKRQGKKAGKKISGIVPVHGENKILVTSNDSRIRLYDLTDFSLACKFRGAVNTSSQIRACMSQDSNYVICGSEDSNFHIWSTRAETLGGGKARQSGRRYRNDTCEVYNAHSTTVTVAMFAPYNTAPGYKLDTERADGEIVVTADSNGRVNVMLALPPGDQARNAPWWANARSSVTSVP